MKALQASNHEHPLHIFKNWRDPAGFAMGHRGHPMKLRVQLCSCAHDWVVGENICEGESLCIESSLANRAEALWGISLVIKVI